MTSPNILTNLIPELFNAMNIAKREKIGFLNAITRDSSNERAAKDQIIRSFITPVATSDDITPGQLPQDTGDQTFTSKTITIDTCKHSDIVWNGEQTRALLEGPTQDAMFREQIAESMTHLIELMEVDVAAEYIKASRVTSPAGTLLFDSSVSLGDYPNQYQVIQDNGGPLRDLHGILNTDASKKLRSNGLLQRVNEAGTDEMLRLGILGRLDGVAINDSAQVVTHTAGTASSATTDSAGYAIGATVITLASAGTGTILAGDRVKFEDDSANEYVVLSGDADVSNGGTITLGAPGLRVAIAASAKTVTVGASYVANMTFARSAIHLVTRLPAQHPLGDSAFASQTIQDPDTRLAFDVRAYRQYHQVKWEVSACWGTEVMNPAYLALLASSNFS